MTPTGDGLVTALQVLAIMRESGKPLSELAGVVRTCPQLLKNVRVQTSRAGAKTPTFSRRLRRDGRGLATRNGFPSARPARNP